MAPPGYARQPESEEEPPLQLPPTGRAGKKRFPGQGKAGTTLSPPTSQAKKPFDPTAGKPTVCCGMCVVRLGTMFFAMGITAFHLICFILTLAYRYGQYKEALIFSGYGGAPEADAAFEFLCMFPLGVVIYGAYNSRRPYSRHILFGGTILAIVFGALMAIIHCINITGIINVIDNDEGAKVAGVKTDSTPGFVFPVFLVVLMIKVIVGLILYGCLAWSSMRHWHYLETFYEDEIAREKKRMDKGLLPVDNSKPPPMRSPKKPPRSQTNSAMEEESDMSSEVESTEAPDAAGPNIVHKQSGEVPTRPVTLSPAIGSTP